MRFNEDSPLTSPEAMSDGYSHRRHGSNNSTDEIEMSSYGEMQKEKDKKPKKSIWRRLATIKDFVAMLLIPILTLVSSGVLMGVMIYIYIDADGKDINYAPNGMRVTATLSLVVTLLKMCIAGGIGYAVSEYKWVRLQNGGSLSLLDVYDACTRGVGGILRVIATIRMDTIIIPTLIFQLGLILLGPMSQEILKTSDDISYCVLGDANMAFTNVTSYDMSSLSATTSTYDMRLNYGLKSENLLFLAFDTTASNTSSTANYRCPNNALNCTFDNVKFLHTKLECEPASFETASIVDAKTGNPTTLPDYYHYNDADPSSYPALPMVFYDGTMHGRTYYDVFQASVPRIANDSIIPDIRARVGDQTFVRLSYQGRADNATAKSDQIQVDRCTIRTYRNNTVFAVLNRRETRPIVQSSDPVQIDYDLLSNRTYWQPLSYGEYLSVDSMTMLNAYSYQLSIIAILTNMNEHALRNRIAHGWAEANADRNTIDNFFADMLHKSDLSLVITNPAWYLAFPGWACYSNGTMFELDAGAYYSISLVCLIPLLWWITMWIIALYQTNGISRGNSQIALLVTGLTAAAREKFKGMSHAGQNTLFRYANQVDIKFGETKRADGRPGHIAFGLQDELHPIRARRRSYSQEQQ